MANHKSEQEAQRNCKLEIFRTKVKWYCRFVGKTQQALAHRLGYRDTLLSSKLHHTNNSILTYNDIREIIKTLAEWQAINYKVEALELLGLHNLGGQAFSATEWATTPLCKLELEVSETYDTWDKAAALNASHARNRFNVPHQLD